MKKLLVVVLALISAASLSSCGVTTVPPGWEGIRVDNWGARRGVENYPIQTGRVMFNPFSEDVYQYPVSKQNYVWTRNGAEGKSEDESISFNSIEGTSVNADVGIVFYVKPGHTPHVFVTYRQDMEHLRDTIVRNEVRDALNREAGQRKIMDLIGPGKASLLDAVKKDLNAGPLGEDIVFETVSFVHAPRPAEQVQQTIDQVIAAVNQAATAQATVAKARAEAEQAMQAAWGDSAATVTKAKGQAEANRILNASLTPNLIEWQKVQTWDGTLPQVVGTQGGMLFSVGGKNK